MTVVEGRRLRPVVGSVNTSVDALLIGRRLRHSVYNQSGRLLLAEGALITREVKARLNVLSNGFVQIDSEDAAIATLDNSFGGGAEAFQLDAASMEKLQRFLGAGATGVQNPRPTVKEGLVFHGREPPSQRRHEELIGEQKAAAKSLDRLMGEMVQGGRSDGAPIVQLTATFLGSMREDSEGLLTAALQSQESGLSEHGLQMGILAMAIGVEMGLNAENVRIIGTTAMVCDWGMMRVPQDIRHASRRLTAEEYFEIQKHPMYTADMVMSLSEIPRLVPPVAYQVHERPDGTGYPRGREGNSIHPFARILRVADVYTSLVSPKPFRGPLTPYSAMEFMIRKANKQSVDRDAVRALLNVLTLFPLGSLVQLSDSSVARVLRRNGNRYDSPVVQVIQDTEGHRVAPDNADAIFVPTERNLEIVEALPTPGREELIFEAGMLRPRW